MCTCIHVCCVCACVCVVKREKKEIPAPMRVSPCLSFSTGILLPTCTPHAHGPHQLSAIEALDKGIRASPSRAHHRITKLVAHTQTKRGRGKMPRRHHATPLPPNPQKRPQPPVALVICMACALTFVFASPRPPQYFFVSILHLASTRINWSTLGKGSCGRGAGKCESESGAVPAPPCVDSRAWSHLHSCPFHHLCYETSGHLCHWHHLCQRLPGLCLCLCLPFWHSCCPLPLFLHPATPHTRCCLSYRLVQPRPQGSHATRHPGPSRHI